MDINQLAQAIHFLRTVVDATVIKGGVLNTQDVVNSVTSLNVLDQHVEELSKGPVKIEGEVEKAPKK
jgi:hypothetical protein